MLRETISSGSRNIRGISARCHYHLEELARRRIAFNVEILIMSKSAFAPSLPKQSPTNASLFHNRYESANVYAGIN